MTAPVTPTTPDPRTRTADPPILAASAIAVVPVVVGVWVTLGPEHALGAAVGSCLVLFNLWLLSVLGPRVVASLAKDEPPTMWVLALMAKFAILVGGFFALFQVLPAYGLLLGFVPMLLGTLGAGVRLALAESAAEEG